MSSLTFSVPHRPPHLHRILPLELNAPTSILSPCSHFSSLHSASCPCLPALPTAPAAASAVKGKKHRPRRPGTWCGRAEEHPGILGHRASWRWRQRPCPRGGGVAVGGDPRRDPTSRCSRSVRPSWQRCGRSGACRTCTPMPPTRGPPCRRRRIGPDCLPDGRSCSPPCRSRGRGGWWRGTGGQFVFRRRERRWLRPEPLRAPAGGRGVRRIRLPLRAAPEDVLPVPLRGRPAQEPYHTPAAVYLAATAADPATSTAESDSSVAKSVSTAIESSFPPIAKPKKTKVSSPWQRRGDCTRTSLATKQDLDTTTKQVLVA